jgi:branched-chain amino acid transport system ATP-binding protein
VTAVLELDGVSAAYGPYRALFDISLHVEPGEALALVGSNGAGKTTVARVASGLLAPTRGAIRVEGTELTRSRTYRFARAGVAHAPEGHSIFATMTVEDNLGLSFRRCFGRNGCRGALERAYDLFPVLGERRTQLAGTLSGGQQRMLSMARVMVEVPKVLIADELSLGLAPIVVDELYESLGRLRDEGTALLVVEQQLDHALRLCSRVVVLEHGAITWTGSSDDAPAAVTHTFDAVG